jgi:hypothetical protein
VNWFYRPAPESELAGKRRTFGSRGPHVALSLSKAVEKLPRRLLHLRGASLFVVTDEAILIILARGMARRYVRRIGACLAPDFYRPFTPASLPGFFLALAMPAADLSCHPGDARRRGLLTEPALFEDEAVRVRSSLFSALMPELCGDFPQPLL